MSSVSVLRVTQVIKAFSCIAALFAVSTVSAVQLSAADERAAKAQALAAMAGQGNASRTNAVIGTFTGTTVGAPVYNRGSGCSGLSGVGTATPFHVQPFTVSTSGSYSILSVQNGGWDGYIHLYQGSFNPGTPLTNCIASNDDFVNIGQSLIPVVNLTAGDSYFLVTSGFANTDSGTFTTTLESLFQAPVPTMSAVNLGVMAFGVLLLGVYVQRRTAASRRR